MILCHFLIVWNGILFSNVLMICMFDIRWKHTCLQTWKQSIYESKAYKHTKIMFLQTRCTFSVRTASFLNEAPKEKSSCSSTFSDSHLFTMEAKNLHFLARFCYQHSLLLHKLLMPYETFFTCKILIVIFANFSLYYQYRICIWIQVARFNISVKLVHQNCPLWLSKLWIWRNVVKFEF